MKTNVTNTAKAQRPLRLWPGIVLAIALLLIKYVVPMVLPDALAVALMGGLPLSVLIILWWAFFRYSPRKKSF